MDGGQERFGWAGDVEMASHTEETRDTKGKQTKRKAVLCCHVCLCFILFRSAVPPAEDPPKPPERTRIGHSIRIHSSAAPRLSCFLRLSTLPTRCYYFSHPSHQSQMKMNNCLLFTRPPPRPLVAPSQNQKGSATHRDQLGPKTHTNQYRYTRAICYINTAPHPLNQQTPPRLPVHTQPPAPSPHPLNAPWRHSPAGAPPG